MSSGGMCRALQVSSTARASSNASSGSKVALSCGATLMRIVPGHAKRRAVNVGLELLFQSRSSSMQRFVRTALVAELAGQVLVAAASGRARPVGRVVLQSCYEGVLRRLSRNLFAFLARLRQTDGNGLFAALHFATLA